MSALAAAGVLFGASGAGFALRLPGMIETLGPLFALDMLRAPRIPLPMSADLIIGEWTAPDSDLARGVAEMHFQPHHNAGAPVDVVVTPVQSTLVQRAGGLRPVFGIAGYNGIRKNMALVLNDAAGRGIVVNIHGKDAHVCGRSDLVAAAFAVRGRKPAPTILADVAFATANGIAPAADRLKLSFTSALGSICIIALIAATFSVLANTTIKARLIQLGERRADALRSRHFRHRTQRGIRDARPILLTPSNNLMAVPVSRAIITTAVRSSPVLPSSTSYIDVRQQQATPLGHSPVPQSMDHTLHGKRYTS